MSKITNALFAIQLRKNLKNLVWNFVQKRIMTKNVHVNTWIWSKIQSSQLVYLNNSLKIVVYNKTFEVFKWGDE